MVVYKLDYQSATLRVESNDNNAPVIFLSIFRIS